MRAVDDAAVVVEHGDLDCDLAASDHVVEPRRRIVR
jgi:hypothetical protein